MLLGSIFLHPLLLEVRKCRILRKSLRNPYSTVEAIGIYNAVAVVLIMVKNKPGGKIRRAEQEFNALMELAQRQASRNTELSRRAVRDAFALSKTVRLRVPIAIKRAVCKSCFTILQPGVTSSTRIAKGRIIITCLHCKQVKRLQYRRLAKRNSK